MIDASYLLFLSIASKRSLEDAGEGPSSKRRRPQTLIEAIEEAGLAKKAMVKNRSDLSRLNNKDRVSLLGFIGRDLDMTDTFDSLLETAGTLHDSSFAEMGLISAPSDKPFPVTDTEQLFIRETYKNLYDEIVLKFSPRNRKAEKRVVVTGTAGIGKSAFLIYFIIRLLATSSNDNPPIVIFQDREGKWYAYGGLTTIRRGDAHDFEPFLNLAETWYIVDSSPEPQITGARTIYSASPRTLNSDKGQYQEVDKRVIWYYHMAPWEEEELKQCRSNVERFNVVSEEFMSELYCLVGVVPRYVLQTPSRVL